MDTRKSAAERMRPILQAMERSIDSVRQVRLNQRPSSASAPVASANSPVHSNPAPARPLTPSPLPTPPQQSAPKLVQPLLQPHSQPQPGTSADPNGVPRLKAKPKRLDGPLSSSFDQPAYRSKAS